MPGSTFLAVAEAHRQRISQGPYRNVNSKYCSASVMKSAISQRQDAAYCPSESFDCCPDVPWKGLTRELNKPASVSGGNSGFI